MEELPIGDAADNVFYADLEKRPANDATHLPAPFQFGASRNARKVARAFARTASLADDLGCSHKHKVVRVYQAAIRVRALHTAYCALGKARRSRRDDLVLADVHQVMRCLLSQWRPLVVGLVLPRSLKLPRPLTVRLTAAEITAARIVIDEVEAMLGLRDVRRCQKYPQSNSDIDILNCLIDGHSTHTAAAKFGLHQSSIYDRWRGIDEALDKHFRAFLPIQTRQKRRRVHNSKGYFAPSGRVGKPKRRPNPWGVGTSRDEYRAATAKFVAETAAIRAAYPEERVVRLPPGTWFGYYKPDFPRPRTGYVSIDRRFDDGDGGKVALAELIGDQKARAFKVEEARCGYTFGNICGSIEPKDDATLLKQGANSLLRRFLPPPAKRLSDMGKVAALVPLDENLLPNEITAENQGRWQGQELPATKNGDAEKRPSREEWQRRKRRKRRSRRAFRNATRASDVPT
jgi:hypothetical protein